MRPKKTVIAALGGKGQKIEKNRRKAPKNWTKSGAAGFAWVYKGLKLCTIEARRVQARRGAKNRKKIFFKGDLLLILV